MKKLHTIALSFAALFAVTGTAIAEETTPAIWTKAVSYVGQFMDCFPGSVALLTEIYSMKDKLETTIDSETALRKGADGAIEREVVRYLENGKDKQKDQQARMQKEDLKGAYDPNGDRALPLVNNDDLNPFIPDKQDMMRSVTVLSNGVYNGAPVVVVVYTRATDKKTLQAGTAWLDAKTGMPYKIVYAPAPLPAMVNELSTEVIFGAENGMWGVRTMTVNGVAGIAMIKKKFKSVSTLTQYFKK